MTTPDLNRGYSDQKRKYQKALSNIVLASFHLTEKEYDFKNLI